MIKRTYTPIAVAYKKKYGKKVFVEEFIHERTPDRILNARTNILPKDCEVLDVGIGKSFYEIYKKKYSK